MKRILFWGLILAFGFQSLFASDFELGKSYSKKTRTGESKQFILKWINEYDSNGNLIHEKDNETKDILYKYDSNNNMILKKICYPNGLADEYVYKYDSNNNMISEKETYSTGLAGMEYRYEYDSENRKISEKSIFPGGSVSEQKYEYDYNGVLVSMKTINSEGKVFISRYDAKGNIYYEAGIDIRNDYDAKDRLIYSEYTIVNPLAYATYTEEFDYDSENNIIYHKKHCKSSESDLCKSTEYWYEYDMNNRIIYCKFNEMPFGDDNETWYFYDSNGNLSYEMIWSRWHEINKNKYENFYEYDYYENGLIKEKRFYTRRM